MIGLPPQLCLQPDGTLQLDYHENLSPNTRETAVGLSPFGQTVHLLLVPRFVEGLDGLDIHVCLCWSRSFIFPLLSLVISLLALTQLSPSHHLNHFFFFSRREVGFLMHGTSCFIQHSLLRLSSSFLGRWILLNISNSPASKGYRTGPFFVTLNFPDFELVCSLLAH